MKRVMLVVAYDGSACYGWQLQPGRRTVESELNRALSELLKEEIQVTGASRTDSGVHALCNVAVFDTASRIPGEKFSYALNQRLPEDIRIQKSEEAAPNFHPRHCESRKTYEYRITRGEFPIPVKRLYSCFTYHTLHVEKMRRAAQYLIGAHDFKAFCAAAAVVESTVRTIYAIEGAEEGADVVIRVCGNGFLYNMVRIIAGTLLEVGRGERTLETVAGALEAGGREMAGAMAEARGLFLSEVEYA